MTVVFRRALLPRAGTVSRWEGKHIQPGAAGVRSGQGTNVTNRLSCIIWSETEAIIPLTTYSTKIRHSPSFSKEVKHCRLFAR